MSSNHSPRLSMDISILLSSPIWPATALGLVVRGIVKRGVSGELTEWAGGAGPANQPGQAGEGGRELGREPWEHIQGAKTQTTLHAPVQPLSFCFFPHFLSFLFGEQQKVCGHTCETRRLVSGVSSQGREDSSHADSVQRNLTEAPHRHGSSF